MLRTWRDVAEEIARSFVVAREGPDWLELLWEFPSESELILQPVDVSFANAVGHGWIRISAVAADRQAVDLANVLARNEGLALGAIALLEGWIVVRHHLLLPQASSEELKLALTCVPHEAARIRVGQEPTLPGSTVLAQYAD
jgi:hypothetical protein